MGRKTYDKALEFEHYPFKSKKCNVFSKNPIAKKKDQDVEFISDIIQFVKHLIRSKGKDLARGWFRYHFHIFKYQSN
jgi:dihydrofolate reductase